MTYVGYDPAEGVRREQCTGFMPSAIEIQFGLLPVGEDTEARLSRLEEIVGRLITDRLGRFIDEPLTSISDQTARETQELLDAYRHPSELRARDIAAILECADPGLVSAEEYCPLGRGEEMKYAYKLRGIREEMQY